jgi:nitroreductase
MLAGRRKTSITEAHVEFNDVVRRRRMVREFDPRSVDPELVDRVLESALHAPSAGYSQGLELIVLDRPEQLDHFWRITDPRARKRRPEGGGPPVVVLPVADETAYLRRYSEPDKQGLGMDVEEGWPLPYWELDAAMAVMLMLLTAVDVGLGAWFFGIFRGEAELLRWLGVPSPRRPIGALGLGYPAPAEPRRGSASRRARRTLDEAVHRGAWRSR